jgi:hypothetical protein
MFGITDKIIGALALVLALALAWQTYRLHGAQIAMLEATNALANGQAAWADERANAATALAVATTKARETEQQLTAQAEKAEHEKQTQLAAVSARADALRQRLRNAEASAATARLVSATTKPSGTIEVAGVSSWAGFSDGVGDGLVRLAERADAVRLQLAACERQYEAARAALK